MSEELCLVVLVISVIALVVFYRFAGYSRVVRQVCRRRGVWIEQIRVDFVEE
jgi:hypothetical protein